MTVARWACFAAFIIPWLALLLLVWVGGIADIILTQMFDFCDRVAPYKERA